MQALPTHSDDRRATRGAFRSASLLGFACALLFLVGASGCRMARTVADASVVETHTDLDAELDFWDELTQENAVTNDDALHGLLLVATDSAFPTFEARVQEARTRGWIEDDEELIPNESARIGLIAMAACDLLQIDGGLTMRVFGPSPRYCTRELVFTGLLPTRTEFQSISGSAFLELLGAIEDTMVASESS